MTPLAHKIIKQTMLSVGKRDLSDPDSMAELMDGVRCFEMSEVTELSEQLCASIINIVVGNLNKIRPYEVAPQIILGLAAMDLFSGCAVERWFAPFPKTWIERVVDRRRVGLLLVTKIYGDCEDEYADVYMAVSHNDYEEVNVRKIGHIGFGLPGTGFGIHLSDKESDNLKIEQLIYADLTIINSPEVIGRRDHRPHKGLSKALRREGARYELREWTEIRLEVRAEKDVNEAGDATERLTGKKALHYCRQHLRVVNGKLVRVRAHWRGDAALGHVQSRYRVVKKDGGRDGNPSH